MRVKLTGIKRVKARLADGRRVEYHYLRGGPRFWATGDSPVGSPAYVAAYQKAAGGDAAPGKTFRTVIRAFLKSSAFTDLSPRSQRDYRIWLERLDEAHGKAPLAVVNDHRFRALILQWRDKWSGRQSDYAWTVARRVVSWAYDAGHVSQHHLRGGGRRYHSDRADIVWTPADVDKFMAAAPEPARRVMTAALETGLRPGDLIRLSRAHIEPTPAGRRIRIRTNKRKRIAVIPVTPAMGELIDATPRDRALILVTDNGRPFSEARISQYLGYWTKKAGVNPDLRLYDARGTAATKLLMAGVQLGELAATFGWSLKYASGVIESYARAAPEVSDAVLLKLADARR